MTLARAYRMLAEAESEAAAQKNGLSASKEVAAGVVQTIDRGPAHALLGHVVEGHRRAGWVLGGHDSLLALNKSRQCEPGHTDSLKSGPMRSLSRKRASWRFSLLFQLGRVVCRYSRACAHRDGFIHAIGGRIRTAVGRGV